MKKNEWKEIWIEIVIGIILFTIFGIASYLDNNFELTNYLWIFNITTIIILPLYYYTYNAIEKRRTKKEEEDIVIKDIDFKYYRDIIDEYSPAMLSFILDGIELKKDFIASVIYLINKGYFRLTENNKIERTDKLCSSRVSQDLQLLCNNVDYMMYIPKIQYKENKKISNLKEQWFNSIEKGAVIRGLVQERQTWKMTSILSVLCILEIIYTFCIDNFGLNCVSIILLFVLIFTKFWAFDNNKWKKTQKGYEIYKKIIGLKNYIKDYSMLSESKLNEISIWDDYLIYAIIFNNTSKINKEAMDFYKKVSDNI